MIAPDRTRAALLALNGLFVHQRNLALDRGDREAANYFDQAEYLPCLMLEAADRTELFEETLREMAGQDAGACMAYNRYLRELGREQAAFDVLAAEHAAAQAKFRAEHGLPPDAAPPADAPALKDAA